MFTNLRNRFIVIAILIVGAGLSLWNNKRKTTTETQAGSIVNLGLDLQGGMHLGLELDQSERTSADPSKDLDLALTVLRKRYDEFGVLEPLIQKVGNDRIVVELPGLKDPARAKALVQRAAFLEFRITDKTQALEKTIPTMDRALRDLGITAAAVGVTGKPSAVQELLGGDSTKKAEATDTTTVKGGVFASMIEPAGVAGVQSMPGEYAVKESAQRYADSLLHRPEIRRLWPRNVDFRWATQPTNVGTSSYRLLYALEDKPIITGASLVNATAQVDPLTNGAEVNFELDRAGGRKFGQETGKHVGDYMAILLDNEVQGRPPVIQSRIDRQGRIQLGGRSLQEAQDLALTLRAGALPTPLKIIEERQVGPSLGRDSIRSGVVAGVVGTALVILIMLGYYAMSGAFAVVPARLPAATAARAGGGDLEVRVDPGRRHQGPPRTPGQPGGAGGEDRAARDVALAARADEGARRLRHLVKGKRRCAARWWSPPGSAQTREEFVLATTGRGAPASCKRAEPSPIKARIDSPIKAPGTPGSWPGTRRGRPAACSPRNSACCR